MSHRHDELMNLLDAWCDDVLTTEQAERIEQIVRADQAAMDLYLLVTHLDGALRWEHERVHVTAADTATQRVQGSAFRVQGKKHTPPLRRSRSVGYTFRDQGSGPRDQNKTSPMASPRAVGVALAATILLAVTAWFALPDFSNPQSEIRNPQSEIRNPKSFASVATLTHIENAAFADTPAPMNLGGSLPAGPIQLTSGSAQIMFASTAVVDLTGPCEFEMTGPNRGRLAAGHLEAFVPEVAQGFTVDLPGGAQVIDLGTRFELHADPRGAARLHVFDGAVDFRAPGGQTRRVGPTQIAVLDSHGRIDIRARPDDREALVADRFDSQTRGWSDPWGVKLNQARLLTGPAVEHADPFDRFAGPYLCFTAQPDAATSDSNKAKIAVHRRYDIDLDRPHRLTISIRLDRGLKRPGERLFIADGPKPSAGTSAPQSWTVIAEVNDDGRAIWRFIDGDHAGGSTERTTDLPLNPGRRCTIEIEIVPGLGAWRATIDNGVRRVSSDALTGGDLLRFRRSESQAGGVLHVGAVATDPDEPFTVSLDDIVITPLKPTPPSTSSGENSRPVEPQPHLENTSDEKHNPERQPHPRNAPNAKENTHD